MNNNKGIYVLMMYRTEWEENVNKINLRLLNSHLPDSLHGGCCVTKMLVTNGMIFVEQYESAVEGWLQVMWQQLWQTWCCNGIFHG